MDVVVKNHSGYTWTSHEESPVCESVEREDSEFKDVFLPVLVGWVVNEFCKYLPSFYSKIPLKQRNSCQVFNNWIPNSAVWFMLLYWYHNEYAWAEF